MSSKQYILISNIPFNFKDVLERDLKEATDFRDDMRSEAKDLGKEFALMQKTRLKELADTKRSLKEKQDMYASIDTYLLRSVGDKSLTSTASSVSLDMYSQGKVNNRIANKVFKVLNLHRVVVQAQ